MKNVKNLLNANFYVDKFIEFSFFVFYSVFELNLSLKLRLNFKICKSLV